MLTRRDQVQAYRFAQARVQAALLSGQPDRPDAPIRRQRVSGFVGIMLTVLLVCGVGVYGLLNPGGKQGWRTRDTLVVEKETGARFVYDPSDGALHPILNYASARLILNSENVAVRQFSHASLADAPRGAARGLPGLPDAFPGPAGMLRGPWVMCSGSAGQGTPWTTLSVGTAPTGGRLDRDHALLVRAPGGREFLVWNDTRLEVTQPFALTALRLDSAIPLPVTDAWLNAVATGPDLAAPTVPAMGALADYRVAGAPVRVGQVQKVDAAAGVPAQYYVALADGLAPVPDSIALLLLGNPQLSRAYDGRSPQAVVRASAEVGAARKSTTRLQPEGFPLSVPTLQQPQASGDGSGAAAVCGVYTDAGGRSVGSTVYVGGSVTDPGAGPDVLLPPGRAAVVRSLAHAGQPTASLFLLTDAGVKFPVPAPEVLRVLGLGVVDPVLVPGGIVDAIPTGRALDPAQANTDVSVAAPSTSAAPTASVPPTALATVTPSPSATHKRTKRKTTTKSTSTSTRTTTRKASTTTTKAN